MQGVCYSLKRLGGMWFSAYQAYDSDKFICLDGLAPAACLVYSFGIRGEWQFEDTVAALGCTVHAFDPSVTFPALRGQRTHFHRVGVAAARDQAQGLDTLANLLAANGHAEAQVFYLKVDIEGMELEALPEWVASGALEHVQQLAMELHLPPIHEQDRYPASIFSGVCSFCSFLSFSCS